MKFLQKYRWVALFLGLVAATGGLLAVRDDAPAPVKDGAPCPNGTKVLSWDTGTGLPADGVPIGRLVQMQCPTPAGIGHD
ncbi:hypothetical protein ACFQY7_47765 [Actinomadura luteofluorescens]|uniref:Uncharacterized protein n=1 Tax=Actinomadura luteofluorescens TaxID=46163 RepID=A0A7Y9JH56_9ACTN|nr:hypothetical protein [Actinomadura luteofluorescens]NYD47004.1 hypothetical protein [Actinomadura luteofluorescens]